MGQDDRGTGSIISPLYIVRNLASFNGKKEKVGSSLLPS